MIHKYYTGIGNRDTPLLVLDNIKAIADKLYKKKQRRIFNFTF